MVILETKNFYLRNFVETDLEMFINWVQNSDAIEELELEKIKRILN